MKKIIFLFVLLNILCIENFAQKVEFQPVELIHAPTAGLLLRQNLSFKTYLYDEGSLLFYFNIGLFSRLNLGISYGGKNLIGDEDILWNNRMELNIKLRLVNETYSIPAIAVGYNSQGIGKYFENPYNRYFIKSYGFYLVMSKNYYFYGNMGLHLGANYSGENQKDDDINLFLGLDKDVFSNFQFAMEYNFALNDNDTKELFGQGKGFLNCKISYIPLNNISFEFILFDLLNNRKDSTNPIRSLRITYITNF